MWWSRYIALGALAATLLASSVAHAKAWTQPEGDGYGKLAIRGIVGDQAFTADGDLEPSRSFVDLSLRHYVEYGLAEQWTILTHGSPIGFAGYGDESTAYTGPLFVGVRRGLLDGPFKLAVEAHYGYTPPLGEENLAAEDAAFRYIPTVETHAAGGELQAGYGFDWGWAVASAGLRWYSRDAIDPAVMGFAQVGFHATDTIQLDAHAALYEPLGDVEETNVSGAGQTRYIGAGLGASWWLLDDVGVALGLEGAPYAESNAGAASITLGAEWRM
ncbi:MAG: hypothetical protein ACLFVJ_20725 [Persicimonas sp.]